MPKYMLIMRPTDTGDAFGGLSFEELLETIGQYNEELIRAGVLLSAEGLAENDSVVVDFTGEDVVVSDGPYGETKELFSGYYILDVASRAEAVEWAKRMPLTEHSKLEIRRVVQIDEFPQDNPWIQKERAWRETTGQL